MSMMEKLGSLASRIRWRSVLALVLLIALVAVLIQSMPGSYSTGGGIGLRVTVSPTKIAPGGAAVLDVELKNVNDKSDAVVSVEAKTYDPGLTFTDSLAQSYRSNIIKIGPQETRRLKVDLKSRNGILEGKYTVDFTATPEGSATGAQTRASITVERQDGKSSSWF
jgi:hypothetical protein